MKIEDERGDARQFPINVFHRAVNSEGFVVSARQSRTTNDILFSFLPSWSCRDVAMEEGSFLLQEI